MIDLPGWVGYALAGATCAAGVVLLAATGRRLVLASLGMAFVGCAALLIGKLPLAVSLAMVASGAAVSGILLLSTSASAWPWDPGGEGALPQGRTFRLVLSAFVLVAVLGLARRISIPGTAGGQPVFLTGLALIGLGALQLGLSERSLRVCVGLLTSLAGFETLYIVLEPSLAIVALLGSVHVVIALVASYLLLVVRPTPPGGRAA